MWSAARRDERFLITQDLDFSDIRQFKPGTHPGLLLVRLEAVCANFGVELLSPSQFLDRLRKRS